MNFPSIYCKIIYMNSKKGKKEKNIYRWKNIQEINAFGATFRFFK